MKTLEQTRAFLTSQGFDGPQKLGYSEGLLYYRRIEGSPCLSNDKLQLTVQVFDMDLNNGTMKHQTATVEITGEYREGTWAKLGVYAVSWDTLLTDLDTITADVLRAWEAIYQHKAVNP